MRMIPLVFPFVKGHEKTHMACCEKYKAYILKYKALILKYMPCIFCHKPRVFFDVRKQLFFMKLYDATQWFKCPHSR